jgi:prepilin-type N-terminal cleavage/methylation domain-containing protein
MRKVSPKLNSQSGVSLVELLVVIIVIAIVASMALLQRGSAQAQFQRQNISRELKTAFERARFDSVKRRAECPAAQAKVTVYVDHFILTTYQIQSGTLTAVNETNNFSGSVISTNGNTTPEVVVSFDQRGEVSATRSASAIAPVFNICNGTTCSGAGVSTADTVLISRTGTVNLLAGLASGPSFGAPGGTASVTDSVNTNLVISTGEACF